MRTGTAALLIAIACAAPSSAAAQAIPPDRAADAAQIRAEIERICQAFVDKDTKTLVATHGKDWRGFTSGSHHVIRGRDGYMNEATFDPRMPKDQGMIGYKLSDFDVVFYGDTAVASFVLDTDVAYGKQQGKQKLTILDVFHKDQGTWVQVASNTSLHPEEADRRMSTLWQPQGEERTALMAAREAVWRAWFAGDTAALTKLVPPELITIEPSSETFGTQATTLENSRRFAASGDKLTRLAFPHTDVQAYGNTSIVYTTYELSIASGGKTTNERGFATEMFVKQNGKWINTGWHLAPMPVKQ
jgi:ketosteroid isomerase-like protein